MCIARIRPKGQARVGYKIPLLARALDLKAEQPLGRPRARRKGILYTKARTTIGYIIYNKIAGTRLKGSRQVKRVCN